MREKKSLKDTGLIREREWVEGVVVLFSRETHVRGHRQILTRVP